MYISVFSCITTINYNNMVEGSTLISKARDIIFFSKQQYVA